jgi:hypothetical protein
LKKPIIEKDESSMFIWQNLINALSSIIEYPSNSNEDFEGNFFIHFKGIQLIIVFIFQI